MFKEPTSFIIGVCDSLTSGELTDPLVIPVLDKEDGSDQADALLPS